MIEEILDWAQEGRRHDIPWCCGLRFGFHCARPKPLYRMGFLRLAKRIDVFRWRPRRAFSTWDGQGYVPCEGHLLLWLATGWRPTIRQGDEE